MYCIGEEVISWGRSRTLTHLPPTQEGGLAHDLYCVHMLYGAQCSYLVHQSDPEL